MTLRYSGPCFGFNVFHLWKKLVAWAFTSKDGNHFSRRVEWFARKLFLSVYLEQTTKSQTFFYFPFWPQLRWNLIISVCLLPAATSTGTLKEEKTIFFFKFDLKTAKLVLSLFLRSVIAEAHCTVSVAVSSDNLRKCVTSPFLKLKVHKTEFYYPKVLKCQNGLWTKLPLPCLLLWGLHRPRCGNPCYRLFENAKALQQLNIRRRFFDTLVCNCTLGYHKPTAIRT